MTHAMHASNSLLQHGRVPRHVHIDDGRCGVLQVESDAAGICGDEHAAVGISLEALDQGGALRARYAAMKTDVAPAVGV